MVYITKFAKQLGKLPNYFKITCITISDESKLHFYTDQTIDRGVFNKRDIIDWEDRTEANKT